MSHTEKTISYFTAALVVLASLLLLLGPLSSPQEVQACEVLEEMAPDQLEQLLERLAADPQRPKNLDAATLTRCGGGELPAEALPCLQERLESHLQSRVTSRREGLTRPSNS
jgi:hypothetical protein